jgi:hypothetical protein
LRINLSAPLALLCSAALASAAINPPEPGWNLFSPQQDVQLGQEAKQQVEQQMRVIHNSQVSRYLSTIGQKLAKSKYAGNWPYSFELVGDKNINAFSLPGGPVFVNTGLIEAAENEAQLAGVLAHEMAHVALRHATNQASKKNLVQIPAVIAGGLVGGSLLGSLARLGINFGANSVLLKFSRTDESQADYLGALMMADAGYNPLEMARFFEKLQAEGGQRGGLAEFLSDHPNPGNRVKATEELIQQLPSKKYTTDTGQFEHIKQLVKTLPNQGELRGSSQGSNNAPPVRPSGNLREYRTNAYSIQYPENWQTFGDTNSPAVTIAPRDALFQSGNTVQIGYGMQISYYYPEGNRIDLQRDTDALVQQLRQQNAAMTVQSQRNIKVSGQQAILTTLHSQSPYRGETEVDALVTVPRPEGLFYLVFIAPQSEWGVVQPTFERMLNSLRFQR